MRPAQEQLGRLCNIIMWKMHSMMSKARLSPSQQSTKHKFVSKFRPGSSCYHCIDITAGGTAQ